MKRKVPSLQAQAKMIHPWKFCLLNYNINRDEVSHKYIRIHDTFVVREVGDQDEGKRAREIVKLLSVKNS